MIERHKSLQGRENIDLNLQYSTKDFEERDKLILFQLENWNLPAIAKAYFDAYFDACYLAEWEWAETFLSRTSALNAIIYNLSLSDGEYVSLTYAGESLSVKGWQVGLKVALNGQVLHAPQIYNCWYWRDVAHTALVVRNKYLLTQLSSISREEMFAQITRYKTINPDAIDPLWHELYLQLLAGHNQTAVSICAEMIEKLEQQPSLYVKNINHFEDTRQRLEKLTLPYLKCISSYLTNNPTEFEVALINALNQHKSFCELPFKKTKQGSLLPNSNVPSLFISMPLLAICSLAYDGGFRWSVMSDYVPQWLIKQDYHFDLLKLKA